jgi:hypothetical protein
MRMVSARAAMQLLARWLPSALWLAGLLVALTPVRASAAAERAQGVLILLPGQPTGTQSSIDAFAIGTRRALIETLPPGSSVYVEYTDLARLRTPKEQAKLRDLVQGQVRRPFPQSDHRRRARAARVPHAFSLPAVAGDPDHLRSHGRTEPAAVLPAAQHHRADHALRPLVNARELAARIGARKLEPGTAR